MVTKQRILNLTDNVTHLLMGGKEEGGQDEANKSLQLLLKNTVLQLSFIESTGKTYEYEAWLKRVEKAHPGIKKEIESRIFVIEEK